MGGRRHDEVVTSAPPALAAARLCGLDGAVDLQLRRLPVRQFVDCNSSLCFTAGEWNVDAPHALRGHAPTALPRPATGRDTDPPTAPGGRLTHAPAAFFIVVAAFLRSPFARAR